MWPISCERDCQIMSFVFDGDVEASWIDYNGHMNDATYSLFITRANEKFIDQLGLGRIYLESTNCTLYTVEMNIKYLSEVKLENRLSAKVSIDQITSKSIKVKTLLYIDNRKLAAEALFTYLHYDQASEKVIDFSTEQSRKINEFLTA